MTVAKVVELIGSSPKSWEDATKNAITEAAKTVRGIKSVYVKRCTAARAVSTSLEFLPVWICLLPI
jgi:flavin-binding protein dodecin